MATKTGLLTWTDKVIPTLFPFFVLTNLMIYYGIPQLMGKMLSPLFKHFLHLSPIIFFIILMSLISGNPSGAKIARQYYDQKVISKREFQGLLYFCNFSSPLFIIGTIGVLLYQSTKIGYFLLASHLLGSFIVFICCYYPYFKTNSKLSTVEISTPIEPFSAILINAIENSIQTLIRVGGIIMVFYIVSAAFNTLQLFDVLNHLLAPLLSLTNIGNIEPLFSGLLEFTQGVTKVVNTNLPFHIQLALIAFIISFAGFSVHTQIFMFVKDEIVSYFKYFTYRLMHGWASTLFVLFSWRYVFKDVQDVLYPLEGVEPTVSFLLPSISIGIIGFYFILKLLKFSYYLKN